MSQQVLQVATAVLAIALLIAFVMVRKRWVESKARAETLDHTLTTITAKTKAEIARLGVTIRELQAQVATLSKWQGVEDAAAKAEEILREAEAGAAAARLEATRLQAQAQQEAAALSAKAEEDAQAVRTEAQELAKASTGQAEALLADARTRAEGIIAEARAKAEALAGDALRALEDARGLERAVEAMKNTLEGYGDRYLIPSHTLIDDLADEVGHAEVGQKLKIVRDQVRQAIKQGRAATCDYVEENRRDTAIRFVVDAFNGKVDSIMAKVRQDNAGTLQQEMKDAFALVNLNGQAFRSARITEEYRDLRLEELRWAATAHVLKAQEHEEQRRVKEQIREEEKARKEYERAMREAARDEELVRKAMEKTQQQLAKASEEQKARYELLLAELGTKLKEAEERNQRALSMAQQTKRGHVYIISNIGSFGEHVYKIGLTRRLEPLDRIRELGDSSVPFEFDVHALIFAEDAPRLEYELHRHFMLMQINKVNYRKEFFRVDVAHIREELEKLGLSAKWTMAAAAAEYRESMKIEELIQKDPAAREAWIRRQLTYEPGPDGVERDEATEISPSTPQGGVAATAGMRPPEPSA